MSVYGYARISTNRQSIERQIRNIRSVYPKAIIYQDVFTGTKTTGRKKWLQLLKVVKPGDTIAFDSVSRMSRNAEEGIQTYFELYEKGVNLVFLKEGYINTDVYNTAIQQSITETGNEIADIYIEATNKVIKLLAIQQIKKAFEQAQKEVDDLHQRTKEGMETARLQGKQIGQTPGAKLTTKKSIRAKEEIQKFSKDFQGTLKDVDVIRMIGISRNSYYKYKRELLEESEL